MTKKPIKKKAPVKKKSNAVLDTARKTKPMRSLKDKYSRY